MLTEIELKNFKCYENIKITDLRNITVFIGKNNAGKSAILQAVYFLRQSISNKRFDWDEDNFGTYIDIVYKHEADRNIEISCAFAVTKGENDHLKKYVGDEISHIKYSILLNKDSMADKETIFVNGIETLVLEHQKGTNPANLLLKKSPLRENLENLIIKKGDIPKRNDDDWVVSLSSYSMVYPFSWGVYAKELQKFPEYQVIEDLKNILINKFRDIYFISDRRGINTALSSLDKEPENVGIWGQNTSAKLHYLHADRNQIFDEIEKWIKKIDSEIQLLKTPLRGGRTTIEFETLVTDVNLLKSGYGLNTVFPVIMQSLLSPDGSTILIEEPEIHLHRGAQDTLFALFLKCIQDEKQIIFTTHSLDLNIVMWKSIQTHVFDKKHAKVWNINSENGVRKPEEIKSWENFYNWRKELKDLV